MSRCYALLLLTCLLAPFAGACTWLCVEKHRVRRAVRQQILAGMAKKDLVKLSFSRAGAIAHLRWEHPDELEYQGGFLKSLFWHTPERWRLATPERNPPQTVPYTFHWDNIPPSPTYPPPEQNRVAV